MVAVFYWQSLPIQGHCCMTRSLVKLIYMFPIRPAIFHIFQVIQLQEDRIA